MLSSIDFHHQHAFEADEIQDEIVVGMLTTKLATFDLFPAQPLPEFSFRIGGPIAQSALQVRFQYLWVGLSTHRANS